MSRFITKAGFFVSLFLLMNTLVWAQNPVTFSVDMTIQTTLGNFDAASDSVVIRGSFQEDAGDAGGNWQGGMFKMADGDADGIYDLVVVFDDTSVGKNFDYKFVTNEDGWEVIADNRTFTLASGGNVLDTVFFNDMSTTGATATITFQADMSDLINGGFFDVANDTLYAPGSHNGWSGPATAADIAQPALTPPTLFVLESEVTAEIGTTVAWKWRTLPGAKFANTGWESGGDHEFEFTGQDIVLDAFKPAIGPAGQPLTNDVTVQFSVDINNATDAYNNLPFGEVSGVFLQGEVTPIGAWGCLWTNDDTGCFQALSDDGTGGDAVAGDGIWTVQVLFPAGTPNLSEYKYGIVAAGSDTLNGGVNHLDNEAGFGLNHQTTFIADQAGTFVLDTDTWGSQRPVTSRDVTFSVDMTIQTTLGNFDAATDSVVIRGSFQEDAGDAGGNWQGGMFKMADGDADGIYDLVVAFNDTSVGKTFDYKFVTNEDGWEVIADNRTFTLASGGNVLDTVFFNDMSTTGATATITFQADMSDLINGGFFDVANDTLYAPGAHNGWPGAPASAVDIAQPALTPPTLFVLESEVTAEIGTIVEWKWRTLPGAKFANTGWESGANHEFEFTGQNIVLDAFKPAIGPAGSPLTNDVTVQFSVDINNATDAYNNLPFGDVSGVFLQGEVTPIGAWGCLWTNEDTGCFQALSDDGTGGDAVAGDGIWTVQVLFPAGTPNLSEYKYGIVAAGSDTLNGGVNPLDNEAGFGLNHQTTFIADQAGVFVLDTDIWGDQVTSVETREDGLIPEKYALSQNYPNPFNPSTQISYDLPDAGLVTLKIYNSIGQEMVTLVNEEQSPGAYVVRWNGANMASGLYFYKLESGSFSVTKKMLLMK